jgi:hypothetical protein
MLIPADLARIRSPLLRARLTLHLLDEPRPDHDELEALVRGALAELLDAGFTVTEIAAGTFTDEAQVRGLLLRIVPADGHLDGAGGRPA